MLKCVQNRNTIYLQIAESKIMNNDRQSIRNTFKNYPDDAPKIMLKHYLFNILSNHTQSMSLLKKQDDERLFNNKLMIIKNMLNKKINKKSVDKIPLSQMIEFHNFNENSKSKNMIHAHSCLIVPRKHILKTPKLNMKPTKKIDESKVLEIIVSLAMLMPKYAFDFSVTHRPNVAIKYMSKQFSRNNDRYTVF